MRRVFRINHDDPRVGYDGEWSQDVDFSFTSTLGAPHAFYVLFRGTGVKFYGDPGAGRGASLELSLDGKNIKMVLNSTNIRMETSVIFSADGLADGDHQLIGYVDALPEGGRVAVAYFDIENSSGSGFDLLTTGPNAVNVPDQAVVVDNTSSEIIFQNASQWSLMSGAYALGRSLSVSTTPGASLSYSFDGVAIWCYGLINPVSASFTVSINGSTPQRFSGNNSVPLFQKVLWSNTTLGPGRHTVTLTRDDTTTNPIYLDFFRILHASDTSTTPTTLPTELQPVASINKTDPVPLAIGLTFGLLAIATVVLGGASYLYRRRGRRGRRRTPIEFDPDASPLSPYTIPPLMTQTNPPSGLPQGHKRPPQPTRLSGVPMPMTPLSELGPPPSYQG